MSTMNRHAEIPNYDRNYVAGATAEVNRPSHYNSGKIEVIDFIEDQHLGFRLANVVKYVCRSSHKGTKLKDLQKAAWYLAREIAKEEEKQKTISHLEHQANKPYEG